MSAVLFVEISFSTEKKENGEIAVQQILPQLPIHGTHVSDNTENKACALLHECEGSNHRIRALAKS